MTSIAALFCAAHVTAYGHAQSEYGEGRNREVTIWSGKRQACSTYLCIVLKIALQREQRRADTTFVSGTSPDCTKYGDTLPLVALRAVLANPLTTEKDIDAVLDEQVRLGECAAHRLKAAAI